MKKENNKYAKAFTATALGLSLALQAGVSSAMYDERYDYAEIQVGQLFTTAACTNDGYSVAADISVNPSVKDLNRLNKSINRGSSIDTAIDEFMRQAGKKKIATDPASKAAYDSLVAAGQTPETLDKFVLKTGSQTLQGEIDSLWQEIVAQLSQKDFIKPVQPHEKNEKILPISLRATAHGTDSQEEDSLYLYYYSENMLRIAPVVAKKYQQRIEDATNGISVMFLKTGPANDGMEWKPAKGCPTPK